MFFTGLTILTTLSSVNPLKCIPMNNQQCKVRPEMVNVNSNKPVFYPFSIKTSKWSGSCNNTNDPYAKLCIPDVFKNMHIKVFNLMSRSNETRHVQWLETCNCKCRLDASFCNSKQRWNKDKCRCEWKELIDKGMCDKGFIWNPSNCECECHKLCDVGEYLDYENCNFRKRLVDKMIEECTENVEEAKITRITLFECNSVKHKYKYRSSCTIYVVLIAIVFTICIGIGSYFIYYKYMNHWYLKKDVTRITFGTHTQTAIQWTFKWD